jgi:uncharacterized MAPEG superfamily protein
MTIAFWCVFVMILFPYIFAGIAKGGRGYDNHDPRTYLATLTGWRKRANYVQMNSFEALIVFGLAVIIAQLAQGPQWMIDSLAVTFVVLRIIYSICYLKDKAGLRSLVWGLGMLCVIGLFLVKVI